MALEEARGEEAQTDGEPAFSLQFADTAAPGGVDLHMTRNDPVAQAKLDEWAAGTLIRVLAIGFSDDEQPFRGLQLAADSPGGA